MSDFADVKIIDLAAPGKWSLNGGPFGSKLVSSMYVDEGVPVIRGANLPMDQRFLDENFVYVSDAKADELRAHTAGPSDVVVTQRGTLGQVGLIPLSARHQRYVISQSQMKLTVNPAVADPGYVYYSFRAPEIIGSFVALASTSGVPHVNLQTLRDFSIPLPPLDTQRRIAAILGAYDDLIEVNRRRVAVMEEMARGLFEEWFVRFRFPGYESVPLVDTPDGPLPQGWTFAPLEDFLVLQRGFDLPKSKRNEGAVPVFSASGFHGGHSEAKVAGPGVVTGRSGTIGQVHLVMDDYWPLNTTLYVREFRRAGPAYALLLLRRLDLAKHASGAAVPTLNRNHIHGIELPAAPQPLMDRFEQFAFANFQSIRAVEQTNERLAASRDLLLPRLISGQLSVEAAERDLELAA